MAVELDRTRTGTGWLGVAGATSLGAGAIHAASVGMHAEHRPAAVAFTVVAALQLGWGGLALVRSSRLVALLGVVIGSSAVAGWVVSKSWGISFIDGLDDAEPIQTADALAAGLALASVVLVALSMSAGRTGRGSAERRLPKAFTGVGVGALATLTVFGMVSTGTHAHSTGEGGHGQETAAAADGHGAGHVPGAKAAATDDHGAGQDAAVEPVPYDPTKPIDLGGVEGVTAEQQAAAENLVAVTLMRLPQWTDPAVAEAAGFRTIGDGGTGTEHFINQAFMEDDVILDPDQPESLVYDTVGGERRLAAAMYMLKRGTPLEDAPNIGGKLMQWHTHENLCFKNGRVAGITDAAGNCPPGLTKPEPTVMIHVWIRPHPCGPFAALEGIGAGRIADGEERLCDQAHGS